MGVGAVGLVWVVWVRSCCHCVLVAWWVVAFVGWLVGWSPPPVGVGAVGWLVGWLVSLLASWSVGWLIGWLVFLMLFHRLSYVAP